MSTNLVITITSEDRPGIVREVTGLVLAHGGNVEASHMARLGGVFAGIMMVQIDSDRLDALKEALRAAETDTLHFHTRISASTGFDRLKGYVPYEIRVSGADHEGIVHQVTDYLAQQGANIEELFTQVTHAPVSGTPLFSMKAFAAVPPAITKKELAAKLDTIADKMGLDIEVRLRVG